VSALVAGMHEACKEQGCVLTGGETSEQPGVLEPGLYILTSSIVGVVEKSKIIDGSKIKQGDAVLAVASNGLHTNGYSLVRALIAKDPETLEIDVAGENFLEAILRPHMCYYRGLSALFDVEGVHGFAHITGGGIAGNLNRILGPELNANIALEKIRVLPIFSAIKNKGNVDSDDMLRTFNVGVGLTAVVDHNAVNKVQEILNGCGFESYLIGEIGPGEGKVVYSGRLSF
jgi:phosphoribosylformylglycinamidine cyclo-ligase